MKRLLLISLTLLLSHASFGWGKTGHRVVGMVAQQYLTKKASKRIDKILGEYALEMSGNYMDFLRSDTNYRHMNPWHYVSIPDGKRYEDITPNPKGDVIWAIETLVEELKTKEFKIVPNEEFAIMALVHFVGDLHQPLHVGLAEDRGGNSIQVKWFGEESNLHRVWDENLIAHQNLSYTEWTKHITRKVSKKDAKRIMGGTVRDWAHESQDLRAACYDFGTYTNLKWRYVFRHIGTVEDRLLKGGIRLAGILNSIYG